MAEQPELDPRFHPAFQRGYEPDPPSPAVHPADAVDSAAIVSLPQWAEVPPPPVGPPTDKAPPEGEQKPAIHAEVGGTAATANRRGINPYIALLWVVGVVLAVGGAALLFFGFVGVFTSYSNVSSEGPRAQVPYVLGTTFGTPLVSVGLATIAGLIFFSAWQTWRRHNDVNT